MDDNCLLMIVLAFVVGYMCSGMMKSMCGGRLVEGKRKKNQNQNQNNDGDVSTIDKKCISDNDCSNGFVCATSRRHANNIIFNIVPYATDLLEKVLDKLNVDYKCVPKY